MMILQLRHDAAAPTQKKPKCSKMEERDDLIKELIR